MIVVDNKRLEQLIEAYACGRISEADKRLLEAWVSEKKVRQMQFKKMPLRYQTPSTQQHFDYKNAFEEFKKTIDKKTQKQRVLPLSIVKYAAVFLIGMTSLYFGYTLLKGSQVEQLIPEKIMSAELPTDKITIVSSVGSVQTFENKDEFSYAEKTKKSEEIITQNEAVVPRGQIFKLILSDGTAVWLNADSKLKYPSRFSEKEEQRVVYLEGEAFFEVAHNAQKPFIVNTSSVDVKVLGTKFNLSSYQDDATAETTLVEGSVNVSNASDNAQNMMLTPGNQARFNKQKTLFFSSKVNTDLYTAWIDRKIVFENMPFGQLIKKIERLYDVEIINNNKALNDERFTGEFDIETVKTIFKALSSTGIYFEYEINDKKITIKDKK